MLKSCVNLKKKKPQQRSKVMVELALNNFNFYVGIQINPLSASATKWSNTFKQFVDKNRRIV